MAGVVKVLNLGDGFLLICDNLPFPEYDGTIDTDVGPFYKGEYTVSPASHCRNGKRLRGILLHTDLDCTQITDVSFPDAVELYQKKLFEYSLTDAWHQPYSRVEVFSGDPGVVRFDLYDKGNPIVEQELSIDGDSIKQIAQLFRSLSITDLAGPSDILDGCINDFTYYNGEQRIDFQVGNIDDCRKKPELYPEAIQLIEILKQVGKILIPLGVDRKCFALRL